MIPPAIFSWIALALLLTLVITGLICYDTYDDTADKPTLADD